MELQQEIAFEKAEDMKDRVLEVMIEGKVADENSFVGRTYKDAPNVDGLIFVTRMFHMSGDLSVRVTGALEYDLIESWLMNLPNKLRRFASSCFLFFFWQNGENRTFRDDALFGTSLDLLDGKINLLRTFWKMADRSPDKLLVCSALICLILPALGLDGYRHQPGVYQRIPV